MGIFGNIKDGMLLRIAMKKVAKNPVLKAAVLRSITVFDSLSLGDHFGEETKSALSIQLLERLTGIVGAENPILKCREEFAGAVLELARYQVLFLGPEPEEDPTGLRGTQGVTGALKPMLLEIAAKNKDLKEMLHGVSGSPTYDEIRDLVQLHYLRAYWFAETLNAARVALGDCNPAKERDWYRPFLHAMCVWEEYQFRQDVGMPSAITDPGSSLGELAYSSFLNSVLNGARYPDLDWKGHWEKDFEDGSLSPPF